MMLRLRGENLRGLLKVTYADAITIEKVYSDTHCRASPLVFVHKRKKNDDDATHPLGLLDASKKACWKKVDQSPNLLSVRMTDH